MQATSPQPRTNPPTPARGSIPIKHISINGLHKTARLLGGQEERVTNGHNYVAFRLGNGRQVHLPNPKKSGTGLTGRKHLRDILTQFLDSGVPQTILEQALDAAGATWHDPPKKNPYILNTLRNKPETARDARWDLIDPSITPIRPPKPKQEPKRMSDARPRKAPQPDKREWCGLDLHEVVQLDLPADTDQATINLITRSISRNFTIGIEPFATLLRDGRVTRTRDKKRYRYQMTESAASILAAEARKRYDAHTPTASAQEAPVPDTPTSEPEPNPEPVMTEPAPTAAPTRPTQSQQPLALNEAIGELIRRHGVTPPLDDNLRLDLQQFIIELEQATRPN